LDKGYLVSGTATGKVHSWRIDHVVKALSAHKKNARLTDDKSDGKTDSVKITTITDPKSEPEYVGLELCAFSDEGIKSILLRDSQVFALVGDLQVKHWSYCYDISHSVQRFQRTHTASVCSMTSTLTFEREAVLLTTGSEELFTVDIESCEDHSVRLPMAIPKRIVPMFFDSKRVVWLETSEAGDKIVRVFGITRTVAKAKPKSAAELEDERLHGPVLNASTADETEVRECKEVATLGFRKSHKFYWGFQLSGDRLAHVCCQNKIKIWDLSNPKEPLYRIEAHKGARKIMAFSVADQGKEVITIGSERKIKIWREGKLVHKFRNVHGEFRMGYPYVMRRHGNRLFYTSDLGIHLLLLD